MTTSSDNNKPSCIILAGGKGSRMGDKDKGLLEVSGSTLTHMLINSIEAEVADIIISANSNTERYLELADTVIADDDRFSLQGPLAGIASCLPACQQDITLVCCCDMPLIPQGLITDLGRKLGSHDLAVCSLAGRRQLFFLMRCSLIDSLITALEHQHLSLMAWMADCDAIELSTDTRPPYLTNINTADDLTSLREALDYAKK